MRRWIPMAALVAGGVVLGAGCGGSSDSASEDTTAATTTADAAGGAGTLNGTVGPGFEIKMDKTDAAAGTYTLNVDDMSADHNFHLSGPGVDVMTQVSETGKKTFTVTLQKGTYTFVCDPHSSSMNGTLTVD